MIRVSSHHRAPSDGVASSGRLDYPASSAPQNLAPRAQFPSPREGFPKGFKVTQDAAKELASFKVCFQRATRFLRVSINPFRLKLHIATRAVYVWVTSSRKPRVGHLHRAEDSQPRFRHAPVVAADQCSVAIPQLLSPSGIGSQFPTQAVQLFSFDRKLHSIAAVGLAILESPWLRAR